MALSRDQILNADDVTTEEVEVPEWGGSVLVRVMSGKQRDALEKMLREGADCFRSKFAACVTCDEEGKALFSENDVDALSEKNANALTRILYAGLRLNGMTPEAVEEAEKNFVEIPLSVSGSS